MINVGLAQARPNYNELQIYNCEQAKHIRTNEVFSNMHASNMRRRQKFEF